MANTVQAKKRARQANKRRQQNVSIRSMMRTYVKKVIAAVEAKNLEGAKAAFKIATPIIDKAAAKGLFHKNNAARQKSRLNHRIKLLFEQTAK